MKNTGRWNDSEFALDVDAAFVQGPSPRSKTLFALIAIFIIAAIWWTDWAVLDEVTHAEGKVVPSSQIQVIQNLEGGIIRKIMVSEGDVVTKDQILMQIDNTGATASYGEMLSRFYTLQGEVERLTAESEGRNLNFSPNLLAEHREIAEGQRNLYLARQAELKSQQAILRQQADQRQQELTELRSKYEQLKQSFDIAKEELSITEPLAKKGVVPKIDLLRLKREVNDLQGGLSATELSIPRVKASIREANRRIEEKYLNFRSEALRQLSERESELGGISKSIEAAKDRVTRTDVRSSVKGIIKEIKLRTIGGVIRPGQDLFEVVPVDDTLLVEAEIRPADIAFLRPDQETMVKLTAYDFAIYGGIPGRIEQISADTIRNDDDEEFYKILVRTDQNYLTRGKKHLPIIPGMVATVDVLTGKKTVLDYLLKPILRARNRALTER